MKIKEKSLKFVNKFKFLKKILQNEYCLSK